MKRESFDTKIGKNLIAATGVGGGERGELLKMASCSAHHAQQQQQPMNE